MKRTQSERPTPRPTRAPGASQDQTDRLARAERELAALRVECAHMHRLSMLGTLAGAVAHEFNNLLTPMSSFAQMAQMNPDDAALRDRALEKVVEGAEQLADIAASLLGMARRDDATDRASVLECVNDALMCLARPPSKNRVRLDVDVDPRLVAAIRPVLLRQVILNLILNAMKAMRPDGGSLIIRARPVSPRGAGHGSMGGSDHSEAKCSTWNTPAPAPGSVNSDTDRKHRHGRAEVGGADGGGMIEIEVQDTGPGVPRWMANRVFDPFVTSAGGGGDEQVHAGWSAPSPPSPAAKGPLPQGERCFEEDVAGAVGRGGPCVYTGTGLGLSICAWLVGDAGGTIRHEEPAGGGARFVVTLPAGESSRGETGAA